MQSLSQHADSHADSSADSVSGRHRPQALGTALGVFTPVSCTIYGVVVFLRLGYVVGQVGFKAGVATISMGFLIALLTVLSLSALITNGPIETGTPLPPSALTPPTHNGPLNPCGQVPCTWRFATRLARNWVAP